MLSFYNQMSGEERQISSTHVLLLGRTKVPSTHVGCLITASGPPRVPAFHLQIPQYKHVCIHIIIK